MSNLMRRVDLFQSIRERYHRQGRPASHIERFDIHFFPKHSHSPPARMPSPKSGYMPVIRPDDLEAFINAGGYINAARQMQNRWELERFSGL